MSILITIAEKARQRGLPLLLAGGHAVIAHGFPRTTFDLDLIICRDDRAQWLSLLTEIGYAILHEGPAFLQMTSMSGSFPVDLMLVNNSTFAALWSEAIASPLRTEVKVVSLRHLVALKAHAIKFGHSGRIVKDADDLVRLIQINHLDVSQPEWRDLILKHGTAELYEKLERATKT